MCSPLSPRCFSPGLALEVSRSTLRRGILLASGCWSQPRLICWFWNPSWLIDFPDPSQLTPPSSGSIILSNPPCRVGSTWRQNSFPTRSAGDENSTKIPVFTGKCSRPWEVQLRALPGWTHPSWLTQGLSLVINSHSCSAAVSPPLALGSESSSWSIPWVCWSHGRNVGMLVCEPQGHLPSPSSSWKWYNFENLLNWL